jgi:hypothetical protein
MNCPFFCQLKRYNSKEESKELQQQKKRIVFVSLYVSFIEQQQRKYFYFFRSPLPEYSEWVNVRCPSYVPITIPFSSLSSLLFHFLFLNQMKDVRMIENCLYEDVEVQQNVKQTQWILLLTRPGIIYATLTQTIPMSMCLLKFSFTFKNFRKTHH